MNAVAIGPPLIDLIKLAYRSDVPVLLEGPHGIGKSEVIKQAAGELGIECIVRDLSLMEPPDLVGIPQVKNGRTVYAPPAFLPSKGKGLLVIEELNRSEKYMMAPCLQLLTERRLNDYRLPEGWLPVAAINPSGEYSVQELDPALRSRFTCIECGADEKEWLGWAREQGVHSCVCRYVAGTDRVFKSSNPRNWQRVSQVLYAYEKNGADQRRKTLAAAVAGLVGKIHGRALLQIYGAGNNGQTEITAEAVLGKFRSVEPTLKKWKMAKDTSSLGAIAKEVMLHLQHGDSGSAIRRNKRKQKNLRDFIALLPAELGRQVRKVAQERGAL